MASARQQCIDAVLVGMKLQFAVKKHGLNLGPNSRAPEYRKLDRHIKDLEKEKRIRASLIVFYLQMFVVPSVTLWRCCIVEFMCIVQSKIASPGYQDLKKRTNQCAC